MSGVAPTFVWVDGAVQPARAAHLSVFDRGFQLGDAVFETMRVRGGRVAELPEHAARLRRSAAALAIEVPFDLAGVLAAGIAQLLAAQGLAGPDDDASVRVVVSRGTTTSRELLPPPDELSAPTMVIQAWRLDAVPGVASRGNAVGGSAADPAGTPAVPQVAVVVSAIRRDPANPLLAVKTTSRAELVYARLEARRAGAQETVFATVSGHLCEATQANVFLVRTGADGVTELATPALECGVLAGTTRSWLLDWARRVGLRPVEGWLPVGELAGAQEVFLSSSVAGVRAVVRVDGTPVGDGRCGPWTARARADREAFITGG